VNELAQRVWSLDPAVTFLNHGSFGACPRAVLAAQAELRLRVERQPVQFYLRDRQTLLDSARAEVAAFVGADAEGLVFVRNATAGVNAVLRCLAPTLLGAGDELLTTDHAYPAVKNTLHFVASRRGARVVEAALPWPNTTADGVVEAVLAAVTPRTKLAVLDHVTSPTGLVLPIAVLVAQLRALGVETLVDGAHGPGMLPLEQPGEGVAAIGAAYYTANLHKWVCAPKGAALLWAREDRRRGLHPLSISHGHRFPLACEDDRFRAEFDWTGTDDDSSWLCVPRALETVAALDPGGWPAVRARNRALALRGRDRLAAALEIEAPAEDALIGSLAALPLPPGDGQPPSSPLYADALQPRLLERGIEVPIVPWPASPQRLLRISAQLYNDEADYERLAEALISVLR
jgi:isopenicillin-N epimerase